MKKFHYKNLPIEIKKSICNGCGGKGGFIKPPFRYFFESSCNNHDYLYYVGGDEYDRLKADSLFKIHMLRDVNKVKHCIKRQRLKLWVNLYYISVRAFGKKFFNYGEKRYFYDNSA